MAAVAITDLRQHLGYLKPSDIGRIEEAYQFSDAAHQGQFRLSGHPYISHPLAVAEIVAALHASGVFPAGGGSPEEVRDLIRRDYDQWRKVVVQAGIKPE